MPPTAMSRAPIVGLSPCLACLACLVLTSACGGRQLPLAPARPDPADGFTALPRAERPGVPADAPDVLRIRPGDAITAEVVSTTTQTIPKVLVDATGRIHLPLVGDVEVGGLSLTEAEARILDKWRPLDKLVQVHLQLTGVEGQRASVLGAVVKPGAVKLVPGSRVADVIALAGGPVPPGAVASVLPADVEAGVFKRGEETLPVDLGKALQGEPLHNIYVQPGDTIYIPPLRGNSVSILGQAGRPVVLPFRSGLRLTEALASAGGVTVGGDKQDIRIIRGSLVEPLVYRANLAALTRGETHDVMLRAGDVVFISDHWVEDASEVIGIISPVLSTTLSAVTFNAVLQQP